MPTLTGSAIRRASPLRAHRPVWSSLLYWLPPALGTMLFTGGATADNKPITAPPSCWSEKPVLEFTTQSTESGAGVDLGPFQLPLSPERPDILTAARISWNWAMDSNVAAGHGLLVSIGFPDPKPYGLPYTVQGFSIETRESTYFKDWTFECESVGISLFPGGTWQESIQLEPNQTPPGSHESVLIRVWGSRN